MFSGGKVGQRQKKNTEEDRERKATENETTLMLVLLERRGGRSDSDKEVALTCTVYNLPLPRWQERPSRWQLVFGSCKTRERERERRGERGGKEKS